jgi:hypothetical protein
MNSFAKMEPHPIEYADRLMLYEEILSPLDTITLYHGPAVASLAAGKTVGVAPSKPVFHCYNTRVREGWQISLGPWL